MVGSRSQDNARLFLSIASISVDASAGLSRCQTCSRLQVGLQCQALVEALFPCLSKAIRHLVSWRQQRLLLLIWCRSQRHSRTIVALAEFTNECRDVLLRVHILTLFLILSKPFENNDRSAVTPEAATTNCSSSTGSMRSS